MGELSDLDNIEEVESITIGNSLIDKSLGSCR